MVERRHVTAHVCNNESKDKKTQSSCHFEAKAVISIQGDSVNASVYTQI